jgi:tetratricopeptide (TPR) repeat protein
MSSKKKRIRSLVQENIEFEKSNNTLDSTSLIKEKNSILYIYAGFIFFIFILVVIPDTKFDDTWSVATTEFQDAIKISDKVKQAEIFNNSINVLIQQIHKHPYHARLYSMLGYMYLIIGNWDSCISNQAIAIKKGSGGAVNQVEFKAMDMIINATVNKAQAFLRMKDSIGCMNVFKHSLSIIPENQQLLKITGGFYTDFAMPDSSLKYLYSAIKYNPNDPEVLYLLGYSYYLKNVPDSAIIYLSKAVAVNSNYEQAKNLLNIIKNK